MDEPIWYTTPYFGILCMVRDLTFNLLLRSIRIVQTYLCCTRQLKEHKAMVGQPRLTLPCTVRAIKHDRTKNTGKEL